jgi:hypothetical protein
MNIRQMVVDLLTTTGGVADDGHEWATAHGALRALEWALDASGLDPRMPDGQRLRLMLGSPQSVQAVTQAHWQRQLAYFASDDDQPWPPSVPAYVDLVQDTLGVDLAALAVADAGNALVRFAAPDTDALIQAIGAQCEFFDDLEPDAWLIQRCIGPLDVTRTDLSAELDRFIGHWDYRRDALNPWIPLERAEAVEHLITVQRTSLMWSNPDWTGPAVDLAAARATRFLSCFDQSTRYFTNALGPRSWAFRITGAAFDTGVVMINPRLAGIWWHAEGDRSAPLGVSP